MNLLSSVCNPLKYNTNNTTPSFSLPTPNILLNFENSATNDGSDGGAGVASLNASYINYDSTNKKAGSYSLGLVSNGTSANRYFIYPTTLSPFNIGSYGITMSAWVRWTSNPSANACVFYFSPDGSNPYYCNWSNSTTFQFTFGNANFADSYTNWGLNTSGTWNHIGWSVDSNGNSIICINGVQKGISMPRATNYSSFVTSGSGVDKGVFILANYGTTAPMLQTGNIDCFRVYKSALTLTQLQSLFSQGI